jgi:ribosomal protein L11 methyltransferase
LSISIGRNHSGAWRPGAHLNSILQGVDPGASPESDIRVEELPDQDWNRQWAQSVRPIRIGRRIVIRPSWEPVTLQA